MHDLPIRSSRHSSGERGLAILKLALPPEWILRTQSESDYGIDVEIEIADATVSGIDVESYEWENEDDQSEYLKAATLRIFIAQGPASAYLIQGSCYGVELMECDLVKGPLPLGTTSNIADVLGSVPTSRDRWGEFLSTIFTAAQQKSIYVAEPIDLIIWKGVSLSSIHRSSIGELEEICQTLLTPISNLNPDD